MRSFTLYGVLGIYLHPSHPLAMQVAKVISPLPVALLGGWVYLRVLSRISIDARRPHGANLNLGLQALIWLLIALELVSTIGQAVLMARTTPGTRPA